MITLISSLIYSNFTSFTELLFSSNADVIQTLVDLLREAGDELDEKVNLQNIACC